MKNGLFTFFALCLMVATLQARETTPAYLEAPLQRVERSMSRDFALNDWAKAIKRATTDAQIYGGVTQYMQKKFPLPVLQTYTLTKREKGVFDQRQRVLQKLLQENPSFQYYTLSVPRNTDLTGLTEEQFDFVTGFLKQPQQAEKVSDRYKDVAVEIHKHYIVKITLPEDEFHAIYLLADCFHKRLHLVNFSLTIGNLPSKFTKPGEEFITDW